MTSTAGQLGVTLTAAVARLAGERGLTVDDLASRAGLPPGSLSPVDARVFDVDDVQAVCEALGITDAAKLFEA